MRAGRYGPRPGTGVYALPKPALDVISPESIYRTLSKKNTVRKESTRMPSANRVTTPSKEGFQIPDRYNRKAAKYTVPFVRID